MEKESGRGEHQSVGIVAEQDLCSIPNPHSEGQLLDCEDVRVSGDNSVEEPA